MKIALITIHNSCNYGAVLQTFATQEVLKSYGKVEIINYQNTHTDKTTKLLRYGWSPKDGLRFAKDMLKLLPKHRTLKKFHSFFAENYNLSKIKTQNPSELKLDYDIYVCGSDQIWNPQITTENKSINQNYFLAFTTAGKKISYASSMGSYRYSADEIKQVAFYLKDFDSISVRELDSAIYLNKAIGRPIEHVLDPTLLLNKEDWTSALNIQKSPPKKPYLLVYVLLKNKVLSQTVNAIAQILNLEVIVIDQNPITTMRCSKHVNDAGPKEYIELFSNASFVITNSFHGCAFSVNFNIPFLVTPPPTGLNRILSLLSAVGAESRAIRTKDEAVEVVRNAIDFEEVNSKLLQLRTNSFHFLSAAITPSAHAKPEHATHENTLI